MQSIFGNTFAHSSGLRCCSPASGMSHRADVRRVRGVALRGAARGRVPLLNAQAARFTVAARRGRLALPAAVADIPQSKAVRKADALAGVRPPYWWRGRAASPLAAVNGRAARSTGGTRRWCVRQSGKDIRRCCILTRNFMQYTEIISVNLCSTEARIDINSSNRNALFDMTLLKLESCHG